MWAETVSWYASDMNTLFNNTNYWSSNGSVAYWLLSAASISTLVRRIFDLWGFGWGNLIVWLFWTIKAVASSVGLLEQASWGVSSLPISVKMTVFTSSGKVSQKLQIKMLQILKELRSWNNCPLWFIILFDRFRHNLMCSIHTQTSWHAPRHCCPSLVSSASTL